MRIRDRAPTGVPPGSTAAVTARPCARRRSASSRHWVDLPVPSGPSSAMNRPAGMATPSVRDSNPAEFGTGPHPVSAGRRATR